MAADRLCGTMQRLLQEKRLLAHNIANLEQRNVVDALTGLGNLRYLRQRLGDALRQLESRGGALCYLLIGLDDPANRRNRGEGLQRELLYNVACRLRNMLRPLDALVRLDDSHFAVVAMVDDLRECSHSSFRRLHDSLNLKALKTSEGFITLKAGISLVGLDTKALPLDAEELLEKAAAMLPEAYASGRVTALRLPQP
ncbi:response regulator PleD [compost metagenome]